MSASRLRYQSAPDRNIALRSSILSLAHRHRRYRAGMIYLKLQLIEPGKPNQSACIESFNGRTRSDCLNEPWLVDLPYAQALF